MTYRFRPIFGAIVMALACAMPATAGDAVAALSPQQTADLAETRNFILTDALVSKYIAVHQDLAFPLEQVFVVNDEEEEDEDDYEEEEEDDCVQESLEQRASLASIAATATALDARPGVHAGLERHGITARDYLYVTSTFLLASLIEAKIEHPKVFDDDCPNLIRDEDMT